MQEGLPESNARRFTGFAETYEQARPVLPQLAIQIVKQYLGKTPQTAVDLGCGTGLSTAAWLGHCDRIVGVEPSEDMLRIARQKTGGGISFIKGYGCETGLPESFAEAVLCSQSFHWMEPVSTLREVNRILKPGGVFATVDCQWPPVTKWQAELAFMQLYEKVQYLEKTVPDMRSTFVRYEKKAHLENIRKSGYFRYCREISFSNTETCTAQRFIGLMRSQGSFQTLLKMHPEQIEHDWHEFTKQAEALFGNATFDIRFCYTMRVGIK